MARQSACVCILKRVWGQKLTYKYLLIRCYKTQNNFVNDFVQKKYMPHRIDGLHMLGVINGKEYLITYYKNAPRP